MKYDFLVNQALINRDKAYAPYTNFRVGVALLSVSGDVFDGANMENCLSRATHAERVALNQAVLSGARSFEAIAVVTDCSKPAFPCGQCLHDLSEFCDGDLTVIAVNLDGVIRKSTLDELLPERFSPRDLGVDLRAYK